MATKTLPPKAKTSTIDDLLAEARRAHDSIQREPSAALYRAFEAGEALIAAKEQMPHGEWAPRLAQTGIPASTARLYMQLARAKDYILASGATSIRQARQLLMDTKPKPKQPRQARVRPDTDGEAVDDRDRYQEGYADGFRRGLADGETNGFSKGFAAAMAAKRLVGDEGPKAPTNGKWRPAERDLKWLIGMAHPDKHRDDKTILRATRVTQWLTDELASVRSS